MKRQRTWVLLLGAALIGSTSEPGSTADEIETPESAVGRATAEDDWPATPDAAVIAAWEKAGARFRWMGVDQDGFLSVPRRADVKPGEVRSQDGRHPKDVPGFEFSPPMMGRPLRGLPQPSTPFAMRYRSGNDLGLKKLAGLKQLKWLSVDGSGVTDAGLKELAGLTQLQTLSLGSHMVTDAGLKELAGLTQLRTLILSLPRVTDAELKELTGLTQLHTLVLYHAKVTDAGLKELAGLTKLQTLHLSHTKVTDAGLKELTQALPKCRIER